MVHMLLKLVSSMISLMVLANLLSGISVNNWQAALLGALVLGLINALLKPILNLLTLPINFLTFGLFSFLLNAALFGLAAYVVPGFEVHGFLNALLGSVGYGLLSAILLWITEWVVKPNEGQVSTER